MEIKSGKLYKYTDGSICKLLSQKEAKEKRMWSSTYKYTLLVLKNNSDTHVITHISTDYKGMLRVFKSVSKLEEVLYGKI